MKSIVDILAQANGAVDKAYAEGLHINKERFVMTKVEDRVIHCRKVRLHNT